MSVDIHGRDMATETTEITKNTRLYRVGKMYIQTKITSWYHNTSAHLIHDTVRHSPNEHKLSLSQ